MEDCNTRNLPHYPDFTIRAPVTSTLVPRVNGPDPDQRKCRTKTRRVSGVRGSPTERGRSKCPLVPSSVCPIGDRSPREGRPVSEVPPGPDRVFRQTGVLILPYLTPKDSREVPNHRSSYRVSGHGDARPTRRGEHTQSPTRTPALPFVYRGGESERGSSTSVVLEGGALTVVKRARVPYSGSLKTNPNHRRE